MTTGVCLHMSHDFDLGLTFDLDIGVKAKFGDLDIGVKAKFGGYIFYASQKSKFYLFCSTMLHKNQPF